MTFIPKLFFVLKQTNKKICGMMLLTEQMDQGQGLNLWIMMENHLSLKR